VRESEERAQITTQDVYDPSDSDSDADNRILDMMDTGLSAPQLLKHLEVISSREFAYEDLEVDGVLMVGRSLAMEKFMEDPIIVKISETTDVRASPLVYVAINGDERWLPRGVKLRIRRKHVERLAQSSERSFTTKRNPSASGEDNDNEQPAKSKSTQAYDFAILHDPCPDQKLARRWFARVTKQST
jgi:hypothetical protein